LLGAWAASGDDETDVLEEAGVTGKNKVEVDGVDGELARGDELGEEKAMATQS
jgi:hypothetical protein